MSIQEYFAEKEILLTGSTGLVGKLMLEKILRDLPDVPRVHILIRAKAARFQQVESPEQRFQREVLASSAFDRLRELHGDAFSSMVQERVAVVAGDLAEPNMGMDDATRRRLQERVRVIINCAAIVSFDAPIGDAIELNTLGPLRLLEFARGCTDPVFAHVSTCYVNGTREGLADESPMDPTQDLVKPNRVPRDPYDVDEEVAAISGLIRDIQERSRRPWRRMAFAYAGWRTRNRRGDPEPSNSEVAETLRNEWVTGRIVSEGMRWSRRRGWNDVYTFTKAMGEQLIARNCGGITTLIFRPSIIASALEEPTPGWMEGLRMMDPLIVAYGRLQLPDFPGHPQSIVDLVPLDKVVNALLASIPTAQQYSGATVYQLATGVDNRLSFEKFCGLVRGHFEREPLSRRRGLETALPPITFQSTKMFLRRLRFRYLLPLRVLEALALVLLVTPWWRRYRTTLSARRSVVERIAYWAQIYSPYSNAHCRYQCDRMWKVLDGLGEEDRERFDFDVTRIDWRQYIQDIHIPGVRRLLRGNGRRARPSSQGQGTRSSHTEVSPETGAQADETLQTGPRPKIAAETRRQSLITELPSTQDINRHLGGGWIWKPGRSLAARLCSLAYRYYLGIQHEGVERVPASGPLIVVANHNSHLDTGAILLILRNRNRCLHPVAAKDYWFRNRFSRWASRVIVGAVPFDRQARIAPSLGIAVALLKENHCLLYFPEGGRSTTGEMQPFKAGIGVLAMESGAPIVPVNISGTFEALPKGGWFPKRHRVRVRFGSPIVVDQYLEAQRDGNTQELTRKISDDVQKAVEALR